MQCPSQVFLNRALRDGQAMGDLRIAQALDPIEGEDRLGARRQLRNRPAQERKPLARLGRLFCSGSVVGDAGELLGRDQDHVPAFFAAEMVDRQIASDPIEVGAHVAVARPGRLLSQTQEDLLNQIGGRVRTMKLADKEDFELPPVRHEQVRQIAL